GVTHVGRKGMDLSRYRIQKIHPSSGLGFISEAILKPDTSPSSPNRTCFPASRSPSPLLYNPPASPLAQLLPNYHRDKETKLTKVEGPVVVPNPLGKVDIRVDILPVAVAQL